MPLAVSIVRCVSFLTPGRGLRGSGVKGLPTNTEDVVGNPLTRSRKEDDVEARQPLTGRKGRLAGRSAKVGRALEALLASGRP